jgi:hypothetical protein
MSDLCYCQYAFAQPGCRVAEIGAGVDPRFRVELICEGPIAAVASLVGLDHFAPERLQGKTAEDIQWLGKIAARHNEIICQAAASSAVLPLRLGTVFHSRRSLLATLERCGAAVEEFLRELGSRQEWGVKLYLEKHWSEAMRGHAGPPQPHGVAGVWPSDGSEALSAGERRNDDVSPGTAGTAYLTRRKAERDSRRAVRAGVHQTIRDVEQRLADKAERSCRIRNLSCDLTGRSEEMVFNAAYLLSSSALADWLQTVRDIGRDVEREALALEVSGPWPPYHFCPGLEA